MKRSDAERVRSAHLLSRLRATLAGIEIALQDKMGGPPGPDAVQALVYSAHDLATCLTKIEAYTRAEADAGE